MVLLAGVLIFYSNYICTVCGRFTWTGGCFINYKYESSSKAEMGSLKVVPWVTSRCQG